MGGIYLQKEKKQNPIAVLFSFAGEAKGKMPLSIVLAVLGELFGMLPFLAAAMLANEVYAGTATLQGSLLWAGGAALGIVMRTLLCSLSSARSHKIAFTILKNIRCTIADKMRRVPMAYMLVTRRRE
jgi:ATP-binding cassette subfamily B protein